MSRNRGHQYALLAGLSSADGDADLQDDLGVIEQMIDASTGTATKLFMACATVE